MRRIEGVGSNAKAADREFLIEEDSEEGQTMCNQTP